MSTSSIDLRPSLTALTLAAALLAGCASTPKPAAHSTKPAVDNVNTVRAVRQQPAAPAATASDTTHQTTVTAAPAAQQAAQQAAPEYFAAIQAMKAGKLDEALTSFKTMSTRFPGLSGPQVNQALIYVRKERWDDALKSLDAGLKINSRNPYAWNLRGIVLRQQGKFADARKAYENALSIDAMYAKAHFNLGVLADLYLQDMKLALEHYEKYQALQKKPDPAVNNWIADLRNRLGIAPVAAPAAAPAASEPAAATPAADSAAPATASPASATPAPAPAASQPETPPSGATPPPATSATAAG